MPYNRPYGLLSIAMDNIPTNSIYESRTCIEEAIDRIQLVLITKGLDS